jgi:hypothetical protein
VETANTKELGLRMSGVLTKYDRFRPKIKVELLEENISIYLFFGALSASNILDLNHLTVPVNIPKNWTCSG